MLNRLEMLRLFVAAAEAKSFKEAALRLHVSPQAVTRAVQELEEHLGELLFHRNTRANRITDFGARLAAEARGAVQGVDALFQRASPLPDNELAGLVRLTAPKALGQHFVMPLLAELGREFPGLRLDLRLSDRPADVVDEQIDIGVRVGFLRDSRFVARAVAKVYFHTVASPALLDAVGEPRSLADLQQRPVTVVMDPATGKPWPWFLKDGEEWLPQTWAFATDETLAEFAAVRAGLGFGQVVSLLTIPLLRSGELRRVLPQLEPDPWNLYVYRPQRGPVAARIRLVFDRLVEFFADRERFPEEP
ncbi:MAG: LysR family transcriptional regulator [Betaproteobacteria bacterium]|nr:MAG: LysR family transcriptional regulator [Betaproteobacteria bacterium]